jgi:hypothetical protein
MLVDRFLIFFDIYGVVNLSEDCSVSHCHITELISNSASKKAQFQDFTKNCAFLE